MNTFKKHFAGAIALAFIVMPALALAQSYDNESGEGSCNDEMNESMTCGGTTAQYYSNTSPNYYSYPNQNSYNTPSSAYYPTSQYYSQPTSYQTAPQQNNYTSYIPSSAMPYVAYGLQIAQQYQSYAAPSYNYYPSSSQYQTNSNYGYTSGYQNSTPNYGYSTGYNTNSYTSQPQSYSYPSGTYGPFGTQLCYWSDYPTYAPCGKDPQQWVQDPYTGNWY
ncbi:MAG: hypothetical protein P4L81_01135 [Candidatus Pacebacteria bacterium]|nr:hypothetical protein [Candidatus Paceibacterota bacterium]